jgi:hypothetical protein
MFNTINIILLILFASTFEANAQPSYYIDRPLLMARNQYLRLYVLHKKNRFQSCFYAATDAVKIQTTKAYNLMVSKYYEAPALYYSLSQDEREVIEQLINMHF